MRHKPWLAIGVILAMAVVIFTYKFLTKPVLRARPTKISVMNVQNMIKNMIFCLNMTILMAKDLIMSHCYLGIDGKMKFRRLYNYFIAYSLRKALLGYFLIESSIKRDNF